MTGTIVDDDAAPELSVGDAEAAEGGDVRFTVRLSPASGKEVTVGVRTSIAGTDTATTTDFTATTTTLTFAPGDRSKTVPVATDDDVLDEADTETFTLTLSGALNATLSATASTATGTIRDNDDEPRITIGTAEGNENTGVVVMSLTLSDASSRQVTAVWYVNTGGSFTAEDDDFTVDPVTPRMVIVRAGVAERSDPGRPGGRHDRRAQRDLPGATGTSDERGVRGRQQHRHRHDHRRRRPADHQHRRRCAAARGTGDCSPAGDPLRGEREGGAVQMAAGESVHGHGDGRGSV